jgi:signal transduction histidine kinase
MIHPNTLRQIPLFRDLGDEQLEEIAKLGQKRSLSSGEILAFEGEPSETFWVLLEGEIQCTKQVGTRQIPWTNFTSHSYFGHELILLNQPCLATAKAFLNCELLEFSLFTFWKIIELCPSISRELFISTAQRTQDLGSLSMQAEKLVSLGTLTSGLAQELREVTQIGRDAVEELQELHRWLQPLTTKLNAQRMTSEQQKFLLNLQQNLLERTTVLPIDINLQVWQDLEIKLIEWLNERNIPHQEVFAKVLTRAGINIATIDQIANTVPAESVCAVLAWLKTTLKGLSLAHDVEYSTQRIAELVQAAKDYTYLDQAPLQEMDIHEGIERTLTMLHHRLRSGVEVIREYDRTLPPICVYGSDLNQVWTHLIDNAVAAMNGNGILTLRTSKVAQSIRVEVIDNGAGIPNEIQDHIFEQFFTTKKEHGTGLGLPSAYRIIVYQHKGQIQVSSQAGCTCFQVDLPINLRKTQQSSISSQVA